MRPGHWPPWLLVHSTPSPLYSACQILGMFSKRYGLENSLDLAWNEQHLQGQHWPMQNHCCRVGCRAYLTSSSRDTCQQKAAEGLHVRVFVAYHIGIEWKEKV